MEPDSRILADTPPNALRANVSITRQYPKPEIRSIDHHYTAARVTK